MSLMDVARGAYVRSPEVVRRSLAPLVSLVPTRLKFGGNYRQWRERIALASADPAYAAEQHLTSLRAIVGRAHALSPFYRGLIERALGSGFDATTLSSPISGACRSSGRKSCARPAKRR
jgi:phenylacetate-CoA ligase